jgi:hypothetical protein
MFSDSEEENVDGNGDMLDAPIPKRKKKTIQPSKKVTHVS